ncbi:MAG: hypothetical protein MUF83_17250 [Acidimicrobiales bacterium]|nr:hypothetical protein [Acidimicrobiales bacterium]
MVLRDATARLWRAPDHPGGVGSYRVGQLPRGNCLLGEPVDGLAPVFDARGTFVGCVEEPEIRRPETASPRP